MYLFKKDLLRQDLVKADSDFIGVKTELKSDPENPELKRRRQNLARQVNALSVFYGMRQLVDLGNESSLDNYRLSVNGCVRSFSENPTPYLEIGNLWEISLLPTHFNYYGEHALLSIWMAEKGALAFVHGMRYASYNAFAAANCENGTPAELILSNLVVTTFMVGHRDFTIRSFPILKPETEFNYQQLFDLVRMWIRKNMFVSDGFIRWEKPENASVSKLMLPNWWK